MGRVQFQVLRLTDSRPIDKHKTEYFLSGLNTLHNLSSKEIDLDL